ncbi:G-protein coupled receptor family C group 6 member A [Ictalurus furcatus]|uniref:G-protein coupled receptor family C group 6 member A n=1 Tax=Ictalurus furcatus TaxID=66913 RepID=UPI002350CDD7|nr:G-protein coupled receptor family C group 6 member A [Ictalurus furcatus]
MLLWIYTVLLCTVLSFGFGHVCDYELYKCGAWALGDIQIGMLSSIFPKVENLYSRGAPDTYNCSGFNSGSFVRMLNFIYTIETINNSSFLPGVRLGYHICDTCCHASKAIQSTEHLLALNNTEPGQCGPIQTPRVKAIIGARYSEVSISVARLLSLYMVPQISGSSSAEALSDRLRYPSFLRTIPSDIHQMKALAKLMSYFEWDWVGVIHGDDDYGKNALQGFLDNAENENVCTAFIETLPYYLDFKDIDNMIQKVVQTIQNSTANIVLIILREELVHKLFTEVIKQNISRTWIASDAWSVSRNISDMNGINNIGDVFGFSFITGPNPGFNEYLQNLAITLGTENEFIEEYQKLGKDKDYLTKVVDINQVYADRLAVLSIAHSLKKILKCNQTTCPGNKDFPPYELLNELKQVNFTLDNQTFYFNTSGNFVNGYDLMNWAQNKSSGQREFVVVGAYKLEQEQIYIDKSIPWYNSNSNTKPISICSDACPPGKAKKLSKKSCCHECIDCLEGTYSNGTNHQNCLPCQNGTWSLKGWTHCTTRKEVYWMWDGPRAIIFLVFAMAGFLLLFMNLIIYLVFHKSPVIKQAGGYIYLLIMVGLALSYTSVIIFIGKPNVHKCRARQVLYGLGFSLIVSCILVKALRTFVAFLPRYRQHNFKKFYKPPVIIGSGTFIQVLICIFWLVFDSPSVETLTSNDSMEITIQCIEGSGMGFGFMLCYIALLALICFILAFKGRKAPQRFNETGHIILSMLIYLFVWVCFTPIYVARIVERYSIQAAAILVSSYGIIFCHFAPKWYMALCKKKDEVTMEAYIAQACNSRPSIASILTTSSGVGSLNSETGLHFSASQISMNSNDTGNDYTISTACTLHANKFSSSQQIIRKRFHRRSI